MMQGWHQVAQKTSKVTFLSSALRVIFSPVKDLKATVGIRPEIGCFSSQEVSRKANAKSKGRKRGAKADFCKGKCSLGGFLGLICLTIYTKNHLNLQ